MAKRLQKKIAENLNCHPLRRLQSRRDVLFLEKNCQKIATVINIFPPMIAF
jgi:hypothetical protein